MSPVSGAGRNRAAARQIRPRWRAGLLQTAEASALHGMNFDGVLRTIKGSLRALAFGLALGQALAAVGIAAQTPPPCWPRGDDAIGEAERKPDGGIVLTLRADGPGGLVGDARFNYAPSDPDYDRIARHVGLIPRGGVVLVRPFEAR